MDRAAQFLIALISDIWESYKTPSAVVWRKDGQGIKESQLLGWLMMACLISFVARLPRLISEHTGDAPLEAVAGANMVAALIFAPLFFYALAGISQLLAKLFTGKASWQQARLVFFWALISTQPLVILMALLHFMDVSGAIIQAVSIISALMFFRIWLTGLFVLNRPETDNIA